MASAAQTQIVSAELDGTSALRVTFSDGVKPVTGVDPAKFRLTVAYFTRPASASGKYNYGYYAKGYAGSYKGGGSYAKGTGSYAGSYKVAGNYKGGYAYGANDHTIYSEIAPVSSMANDKVQADQAVLQLGSTFSAATACQQIKALNAANSNAHAGLYLHYTEAGSPTIEDTNGKAVASLAAYWSSDPTAERINGDFVGKPIPVSITCP